MIPLPGPLDEASAEMADEGRTLAEAAQKKEPVLRMPPCHASTKEKAHKAALEAIEEKVEDEITDAIRFAEEPEPRPEVLEPTTYAGPFAR